jgi:hypothetical protein
MNPTILEIPLIAAAQTFTITLVGVTYTFTLHWCAPASCWILDIGDLNNVPIVGGIPVITGADLLEPYGYLNIGGQLIASTDFDPGAVPTFDNLGSTGHLFFEPNT